MTMTPDPDPVPIPSTTPPPDPAEPWRRAAHVYAALRRLSVVGALTLLTVSGLGLVGLLPAGVRTALSALCAASLLPSYVAMLLGPVLWVMRPSRAGRWIGAASTAALLAALIDIAVRHGSATAALQHALDAGNVTISTPALVLVALGGLGFIAVSDGCVRAMLARRTAPGR